MNWKLKLGEWRRKYDCEVIQPISAESSKTRLDAFGTIPSDFHDFYSQCNGISSDRIIVFSLFDSENKKRTGNSLERANNVQTSYFFEGLNEKEELLNRFFIFAELKFKECAAVDRNDGTIWYQDQSKFHQTNTHLAEFIELCLNEAQSL